MGKKKKFLLHVLLLRYFLLLIVIQKLSKTTPVHVIGKEQLSVLTVGKKVIKLDPDHPPPPMFIFICLPT